MSVLGFIAPVAVWLVEHSDLIEDLYGAVTSGTPVEALKTAIRKVQTETSRASILEELGAAEDRRSVNRGAVAHDAFHAVMGKENAIFLEAIGNYESLPAHVRAAWEASADAAFEAR